MNRQRLLGLLLAGTAFTALASNAFAIDGNDIVAKLNAFSASSGATLMIDGAKVEGSTVTLTGAKVKIAAASIQEPKDQILSVGDITLEGVTENNGGYSIDKMSFADVDFKDKGAEVTAKDIYAEGVELPAEYKPGTLESILFAQSFHVGAVSVIADNKPIVSIEESNVAYQMADDHSKVDADADISGLKIDLSSTPDPKAQDTIKALGLETLSGDITMKGDWTLADGKLNVTEYALDFANVGRLDMTFSISGYTLDFIKGMQEAMKAAESNPDKAAGQQMLGLSMMGLMQQLIYNGANIRFEDDGITAKAFDYAGKQQGVDGPQFAQSIKGMLPILLAQLNMPDLQKQIVDAANAFIDDPKTINVSANPAAPLPAPQIMGAAMGNPADLVKTLNVQIKANQ